ncbi:hypothetical protein ABZ250_43055 [Streptomyces afghaniensis]|uniref:hypothetical protein n=1 Tax=Streptomyces afghaniensis TaxID=66865 RepID=UPI0033BD6111
MAMGVPRSDAVKPDPAAVTGVRVFTRMPVTLSWLSREVVPVARELTSQGAGQTYLRRGWLYGPHVDIIARGIHRPGPDWKNVAARLHAEPVDPAKELSGEKYLRLAREFGRLEAVPPPYLPLREHGAVEFVRLADVGSREPLLNEHQGIVLGALSQPFLHTIDELAADPSMATVRLAEAFAAIADVHPLGPGYGVLSLRSHAEAFLAWAAPTKDMRPAFTERLAGEAPRLRAVVEQRISGEVDATAAAWRTALAYCSGALDSAVATGALGLEMLDSVSNSIDRSLMGPPGAPEVVPQGDSPDTEFHRAVDDSGLIDRPLPWFATYRLLINLFYQQLPLLMVTPLQRYYMCHAIAETVDEVLGESWRDRLRRRPVPVGGRAA